MNRLVAVFYDAFMRRTEEACLGQWREELLDEVGGEVLEIGAGTGINLTHYTDRVNHLVLVEPDANMQRQLVKHLDASALSITLKPIMLEQLDYGEASFDAVVSTLVLCSVSDLEGALRQIYRLLKPGGKFYFIEHVASVDSRRYRWQHLLEPLWKRCAGNCYLTRDVARAIEKTGFEMTEITRESMRKALFVVRPSIRGVAVKQMAN